MIDRSCRVHTCFTGFAPALRRLRYMAENWQMLNNEPSDHQTFASIVSWRLMRNNTYTHCSMAEKMVLTRYVFYAFE